MTFTARLLTPLAILILTGCGAGTTDVTGSVQYQGKPIVFGTVAIIDGSGLAKYGTIRPDGTFDIKGVKLGVVKVTVSSPKPPGLNTGKPVAKGGREDGLDDRHPADADTAVDPVVAKGWFPIPDDLGMPERSNIEATIEPGKPLTLDLK